MEGKRRIIPSFKWKTQSCVWYFPSVLFITLLLCVFFSLQSRALSILLWQWNDDDEPCLQGAIPQGQPHTNKNISITYASVHMSSTHKDNMHAVSGHFFCLMTRNLFSICNSGIQKCFLMSRITSKLSLTIRGELQKKRLIIQYLLAEVIYRKRRDPLF